MDLKEINRMNGVINAVRENRPIPKRLLKHNLQHKGRKNNWYKDVILNELGRECAVCASKKELCLHHKIPCKDGGEDRLCNLIVMCRTCHVALHSNLRVRSAT